MATEEEPKEVKALRRFVADFDTESVAILRQQAESILEYIDGLQEAKEGKKTKI